ncbi:hypothetical protein PF011_g31812 [Phytophthora fragariae]|uniref:Uncharacterized protein n=1 Tax=Phytophthora fragariae TaxID=53985 RepID=A0A6A3GAE8_9STRA|nr:hypothetical protein PF011_g31812 [Phytophthora fragariae]
MHATENSNDSARQSEIAENQTEARQGAESEPNGNPKDRAKKRCQSWSQSSRPMSPCEYPSPTQREQAQNRRKGDNSVDLRRESGLESVDQTSGVDLSAYAHYDAGETIGKLVTNPLRQLSAPTRVSEHPTPNHGKPVTLSDSQVALPLQLDDPSVETADLGSGVFSMPLRRPPH